jgi:transglutaminase-like putative cysteine protease
MKLFVEHETVYRFDEPADHSIQYLRVTPRRDSCQYAVSWQIMTPGAVFAWTDGFDNLAHVSVQERPHHEVVVSVRGEVSTIDTNGILPPDDGLPPLIFLRPTAFTAVDAAIEELAAPFAERKQADGTLAALHRLMNGIGQAVSYRPGFTDVETPAAEALRHGYGVCQDHAHLFIACCRVLGVPARYVSGYLLAGDHNSHLASHAWAEAFIENLGWVSFDPTNQRSATDAYVRLAIGFDYANASPIQGLRRGGGHEKLSVRVQVGQAPVPPPVHTPIPQQNQ